MKVEQLMTRDVVTVDPSDTVEAAIELLEEQRVRHLPVVTEGKLLGIVSDRGLSTYRPPFRKFLDSPEKAAELLETPVAEAMRREVKTVAPDDPVVLAVDRILAADVGALPVVRDGELVGIVSYTDILQAIRDRV